MTSPVTPVNLTTADTPEMGTSRLERRLFLILAAVALIYAFCAGLRTISDFDFGWQLATGRWVAQHHHISSIDVFSFTAQGEPWVYPVGAGLVLYAAYLLGGYALISWIGAAACVGTIALLLRRGSAVSAGIAIIAVPLIAWRTAPRADMFTVVLFAAFLSLLWENYQTGRARLWLLPLLMVAWVNLHFGFAAGLALILAYVGVEISETIFGDERRRAAMQRLRRAWGWLVLTALVTLANPWGWGIYQALMRQERAAGQQQLNIGEWSAVPLTWSAFSTALSLEADRRRDLPAVNHCGRGRGIGIASTQFGSGNPAAGRHVSAGAPCSDGIDICLRGSGSRRTGFECSAGRLFPLGYSAGTNADDRRVGGRFFFASLALLRSFDLVTNRHYVRVVDESNFGAGLGWWFPERAAEFIARENLPGEIFDTYDEGSYLIWKLGPAAPRLHRWPGHAFRSTADA